MIERFFRWFYDDPTDAELVWFTFVFVALLWAIVTALN